MKGIDNYSKKKRNAPTQGDSLYSGGMETDREEGCKMSLEDFDVHKSYVA